ncbi:hypothetical protein [Tomitella biformata]|uniref:hypothetical protein n=1 Tax=Tomitella biformata TaxID=630403 RepID=UPI000465683D|nr:hypothetical protein [Tomitella biformata]
MTTDTPNPDATSPDTPRARGILRQPLAWVAVVLLLALVGTAVALVLALRGAGDADQRAEQAQSVARDYGLALAQVDYRTLDQNRDQAAALTTESFRGPTSEIFDLFATTLTDAESVSTATADEVGIASIDDDSAVALVFLNQRSVNLTNPEGAVQGHRLRVELVRDGGQWLVNGAEFK